MKRKPDPPPSPKTTTKRAKQSDGQIHDCDASSSSDDSDNGGDDGGSGGGSGGDWDLTKIHPPNEQSCTCEQKDCRVLAMSTWRKVDDFTKEWKGCFECSNM